MKSAFIQNVLWISTVAAVLIDFDAQAASLINNGSFEDAPDFAGWTRADQTGSEGTFFLQTGTTSPVLGETVPAPPAGSTAAMTDAEGPGSHVLYQSFALGAAVGSATLEFDLFIGNRADAFRTPNTLDFAVPASGTTPAVLNQQARV